MASAMQLDKAAEPQRALYSLGRLPYLPELAANLETELGWIPAYWITQAEQEDAIARCFPQAVRHDFTDANRGINDPIPRGDLPPTNPELLIREGLLLRQGLGIVSRHVLGRVMTPDQQVDFLVERLEYAYGITLALDLNVLVLLNAPHSVIEFAFYTVFKLLGRKIRISHLTGYRGLRVVLSDMDASSPLGISTLVEIDESALSDRGRSELEEIFDRNRDHPLWYVRKQELRDESAAKHYATAESILDERRYPANYVDFCNQPARPPSKYKTAPTEPADPQSCSELSEVGERPQDFSEPGYRPAFKRNFKPDHDNPLRRAFAHSSRGFAAPQITGRQYFNYRCWALLTKRRWAREYSQLTNAFDFSRAERRPYVYFGLHYQPERTTSPEGGIYSDQILALRMIARSLPRGWRLVVKEHPAQFRWQTEGELGRWDSFYDQIDDLGVVDLAPLDFPSESLIQSAQAVVTVTGTVGWEAAVNGVPAITLAKPWYAADGLVLKAQDGDTLIRAFKRIARGWKPQRKAIAAHLARLERLGRRCFIVQNHAWLYEELSDAQNLAAHSDLFVSAERLFLKSECAPGD